MQKLKTRKLNRLKGYNYSAAGYYFLAICSRSREIIFGEINNKYVGDGLAPSRRNPAVRDNNTNNIKLSKLGQIIERQWNDLPNQFDNVELDECIIMPNHLHGILIINKRTGASPVPTIY